MLIGITGKAGSGKDTIANILVEDFDFKRYAFADAVRDVALAIDPYVFRNGIYTRLSEMVDDIGWDKAKREYAEPRRLLQVIGTEAGRQLVGENVWVDIVKRKWTDDGKPNAVITDMRFPNEFEWVHNLSEGITLTVERPDNPDAIASTHASEAYSFKTKYTLTNNHTLETLRMSIHHLMSIIAILDAPE